jgi:B-cell receptor-associated protein 31
MHVITNLRDHQTASASRSNVVASDQTKEIERLKRDLGKVFAPHNWIYLIGSYALPAALKEQASSQATEYDRLADQYNKETGKPVSDKRVD